MHSLKHNRSVVAISDFLEKTFFTFLTAKMWRFCSLACLGDNNYSSLYKRFTFFQALPKNLMVTVPGM